MPTRNRPDVFQRTLESLAGQSAQPAELVVIDGSDDDRTALLCRTPLAGLRSEIVYRKAARLGAAIQRNEGVAVARHDVIWFHDDDVIFEPECVFRLWAALHSEPQIGGVNATITNQGYHPPSRVGRVLYRLLDGKSGAVRATYAGRCVGPGVNLLPEDRDELPDVVPVDWLNTTCTLYRRVALPNPAFDSVFHGYSLCEDLALSLRVGRAWKLANARTARIFHDSQPGDHKRSHSALAAMELVNRHYVMSQVLNRQGMGDYLRLGIWEAFQMIAAARGGPSRLLSEVRGKAIGTARIVAGGIL